MAYYGFIVDKFNLADDKKAELRYAKHAEILKKRYPGLVHDVVPWCCCSDPRSVLIVGYSIENRTVKQLNDLMVKCELENIRKELVLWKPSEIGVHSNY